MTTKIIGLFLAVMLCLACAVVGVEAKETAHVVTKIKDFSTYVMPKSTDVSTILKNYVPNTNVVIADFGCDGDDEIVESKHKHKYKNKLFEHKKEIKESQELFNERVSRKFEWEKYDVTKNAWVTYKAENFVNGSYRMKVTYKLNVPNIVFGEQIECLVNGKKWQFGKRAEDSVVFYSNLFALIYPTKKYEVIVLPATRGSVTAPESAAVGDTVNLLFRPDSGFEVEGFFTFIGLEMDKHPCTDQQCSFIMPNSDVKVGGVFRQKKMLSRGGI
ncbi:MAG: hypothetical protein MJY82_03850 [Fibrobacter sp.]|nr:hypothetical protein [Fibrobacter sp.]